MTGDNFKRVLPYMWSKQAPERIFFFLNYVIASAIKKLCVVLQLLTSYITVKIAYDIIISFLVDSYPGHGLFR